MFPSHVFALLLVREANNALTLGKVLGYVRKNPELSMQLACRSRSTRECFVCSSPPNVSLVLFATECALAKNVFPRPSATPVAVSGNVLVREVGHKAVVRRQARPTAVSELTFAEKAHA
jgi:hypothetical protein